MKYTVEQVLKLSENQPVLVDFFATWCKPCETQSKTIDLLEKEFPEVHFLKIDVDQNEELVTKYKVMGVPTLLLLKKSVLVWKEPGVLNAEQLKKVLFEFGM